MNTNHINTLIQRFLDAQTTEAEEQQLADYFATAEQVPAEWEPVRQMFLSFQTDDYNLEASELEVFAEAEQPEPKVLPLGGVRGGFGLYRYLSIAACAAAVFLLVGAYIYNNVRARDLVAEVIEPTDNTSVPADTMSYPPEPTAHPPYLKGGAEHSIRKSYLAEEKNIKHVSSPVKTVEINDFAATNTEPDEQIAESSPHKIGGVPAEQAGGYDNRDFAYDENTLAAMTEGEAEAVNAENARLTDEEIAQVQQLEMRRFLAAMQEEVDYSNARLKRLRTLLANNQ